MKKIILFILVLLPSLSNAQVSSQELKILTKNLGIPSKMTIQAVSPIVLPQTDPLTVFIATGLDLKARQNLEKWIEKWNKSSGKKKGVLKIVSQFSQAQIILARYVDRENAVQVTRPVIYAGSEFGYFPYPYRHHRHRFYPRVTIFTPIATETYTLAPVHSYLFKRDGNHLFVLAKYDAMTTYNETSQSGKDLYNDFKKLLDKRYKDRKKSKN